MSTILAAGAIVAATVGWFTARRAQYERVIGVTDHISSAAVADARHSLGALIAGTRFDDRVHCPRDIAPQQHIQSNGDLIKDLFIVLWAFDRILAVDRSIPRPSWAWKPKWGPKALLRSSTEGWVRYWNQHLDRVIRILDLDAEAIGSSRASLTLLVERWKLGTPGS